MTAQPETTTRDTQNTITDATRVITAMWPAMYRAGASGASGGGDGAGKRLYSRPDDANETDDLPRIDALLDLRITIEHTLAKWAKTLVQRRHLRHALPDAGDATGLAALIARHADWWSGQADGPKLAAVLTDAAHECARATFPPKALTIRIGECPWCQETVRARPGNDEITCRNCGCTGGVHEWIDALAGMNPVTLPALADVFRRRLGLTVTDRTLRRWHADGILTPLIAFGPQPRWPRFDPILAMRNVSSLHRPCPACGKPWNGSGDICFSCRPLLNAKPTRARRRGVAVLQRPPKPTIVPLELDPELEQILADPEQRCEETGLFRAWCLCAACET